MAYAEFSAEASSRQDLYTAFAVLWVNLDKEGHRAFTGALGFEAPTEASLDELSDEELGSSLTQLFHDVAELHGGSVPDGVRTSLDRVEFESGVRGLLGKTSKLEGAGLHEPASASPGKGWDVARFAYVPGRSRCEWCRDEATVAFEWPDSPWEKYALCSPCGGAAQATAAGLN